MIICLVINDITSEAIQVIHIYFFFSSPLSVHDTIIHSIHSLFPEWNFWTWQIQQLLFNITHGWPDRKAVAALRPSAVSVNIRHPPPTQKKKKHIHYLPQRKELNVLFTQRPASFWKLLNHFFSSCPCDILLYIVSGGKKHFLSLWNGNMKV